MSTDQSSLCYLTPGLFLIHLSPTTTPESDLSDRWQMLQPVFQSFWTHWRAECLNQLQQRRKWKGEGCWAPALGDIILKEDRVPALSRKMGFIENLHPGPNGLVRMVIVRTAHAIRDTRINTSVRERYYGHPNNVTYYGHLNSTTLDCDT